MATAKVLVVAGGGGGGYNGGGGGGAGGVAYDSAHTVTAQAYTITIGGGGAGSATDGGNSGGVNGSNSVFDVSGTPFTATGGGGGGSRSSTQFTGKNGGSGGGGSSNTVDTPYAGGTGSQGYNGGSGQYHTAAPYYVVGGGGGGAGAVGSDFTSTHGGNGGVGIADASIGGLLAMASAGVSGYIAGGGGGGTEAANTLTKGSGGTGGGGDGQNYGSGSVISAGTVGTANTGGGGGGGQGGNTFSGGSGIVIIAYTTADFTHTGGNATGTSGSLTWVKFTASGTLTLSPPTSVPTVTTQAVSDIAINTATGNGNVTDDGGATVTERGVCIGASANPTTADTKFEAAAGGEGAFTASMTSLSAGTHYHVRAYAINSVGTSYGADVEFDTEALPPWRFENLNGLTFDHDDTKTIYAERLNEILDRLHALDGLEPDPEL